MRTLIVNAEDFGHSAEVNMGVVEAHERGIVTSASLMVRRPAATEASGYRGGLSIGLHVELGEWTVRDGDWHGEGAVPPARVEREVRGQLEEFRRLTGRDPTHVDSHQHVHREEPARSAVLALGEELDVPVRELRGGIRYVGGFYGQDDAGNPWPECVSVENLLAILERLGPGATELGCHPGRPGVRGTSYAEERAIELQTLVDPRVRRALDRLGLRLAGFADLAPE
jgi:predicted glycoside hydrolase/deacetylase ChbG (UPF0249 family)